MAADGSKNRFGLRFKKTANEVIGMLCFQPVWRQPVRGKIPQVEGHDCAGTTVDRRRQNMAVADVREVEFRDESFVIGNDRLGKVLVHDRTGALQPVDCEIGPVGEKVVDPFFMNRDAPKRLVQVLIRQPQKKVSKAGGIQDVGVEQRRQTVHRLLQAEFLILGSQLVQRISATRLRIPTIGENVFGPHTPM